MVLSDWFLIETGRYKESAALHRKTLERSRAIGVHPELLASTCINLGQALYRLGMHFALTSMMSIHTFIGQTDEAIALHKEAIQIQEENQGRDNRLSGSYNSIAALYLEQGGRENR